MGLTLFFTADKSHNFDQLQTTCVIPHVGRPMYRIMKLEIRNSSRMTGSFKNSSVLLLVGVAGSTTMGGGRLSGGFGGGLILTAGFFTSSVCVVWLVVNVELVCVERDSKHCDF